MREIVSPLSGIRSPFGQLTSPLAIYAVLGIKPQLVLDFDDEKYFANSARSTFSSSITHSASSNATMVDSDGLLKWRPHNLLPDSTTLDSAAWGKTLTLTSGAVDPDGGTGAYTLTATANSQNWIEIVNSPAGTYTRKLWVRRRTGSGNVRLFNTGGGQIITAITTSWQEFSASGPGGGNLYVGVVLDVSGDEVDVYAPHLYRSDLGGMVNNPDRGDSYVPTTSQQVYLPRRGHHVYNGSAWVNEGVLHESEARTNLVTYSAEFDNAAWLKYQATVSANVDTAPDGTQAADKLVETVSAGQHHLRQAVSSVANVIHTASLMTKAAERTRIRFGLFNSGISSGAYAEFNLTTEAVSGQTTIGTATNVTYSISPAGNGFYRCSVSATVDAASTSLALFVGLLDASGAADYTGDGTSGIYIYGAQLEAGSTPSSYIPNAGATSGVIRAAETLTIPAANLPYSATAMSIQMEGRMTYADTGVAAGTGAAGEACYWVWLADGQNYLSAVLSTTSTFTGTPVFIQENLNVRDAVAASDVYSPGINVPFNIASRHGSTFINGAVDGTALTADTTPTALPDLSATNLSLGNDMMGTIKLFRIWANDLADAGIAEASITAPLIFGVPTISGNENQGATLTATSAPVVIGTPTPTTTWQWNRGGSAISGATSSTYTLTGDDVGFTITVTQTETNAGGADSATSAATGTIVAVPAGAIAQRDGSYILDRAGSYIEVRA